MTHLWQHPYVNVFKHFEIQSWKKCSKEGEVMFIMDKTLRGSVYRITGTIPANNYIQLPKTSTQSLGLTGRYLYLLFKPIAGKYFVVHLDVATQDGLVVRISFSNLFKEFKSTSTWLQFPFICHPAKGSISAQTAAFAKDQSGPAPLNTRWTVLCLDMSYMLSMYLNRRYSYIKTIKLCANMFVKNMFTSDSEYEPGVTVDQVKKSQVSLHGVSPLPREMAFHLNKGQRWHDVYDLIKFPASTNKQPFDSVQYTKSSSCQNHSKSSPGTVSPRRVAVKTVDVSRPASGKQTSLQSMTSLSRKISRKNKSASQLPFVNVDANGDISVSADANGEVHIFARQDEPVVVHRQDKQSGKVSTKMVKAPAVLPAKKDQYKGLTPDPIISLRKIVGFGGASFRDALWTSNGSTIVYPCHGVVVAMVVASGNQRFFIGHTDKVSCISLNASSSLLASGQSGPQSVVRVWKFQTGECLAVFKTHSHSLQHLSLSHSGNVLCGVGKDSHGKNMVVIWNTSQAHKGGSVAILAKAHTEVDISRMRVAAFDEMRMVSCGRDNIRLWRMKDGQLRSAPVNLGEYHTLEFTDCCFEAGYSASKDPIDRIVYACSRSGHIFEVDYRKVAIHQVRKLLPTKGNKEKQTFASGSGIAINSMSINEAFCITASNDGYLRLWPLDFKHVYLEAEHEGPVTAVDLSSDGMKVLIGTCTGNLGILDVSTRAYTTVMRSHTDRILSVSIDPYRRQLLSVSEDHTIRIWDMDTMQQLYDFTSPKECPCTVVFHPSKQMFACGFASGAVRVFAVSTTSMVVEHKQHRGKVVGLAYSPSGDYLYSAGSLTTVALHDASDDGYELLRVLGNTIARGESRCPNALAVSPNGHYVAFVGPTEFTVSVCDGRSLDEVLRIDITSLNPADNSRTIIDVAERVMYTPSSVSQLLVTTSSHKLLKFDARSGRILAEIDNIHRSSCTSLAVSGDGRHLATAGDKVIKIWDYHMRLDLNFQVFIGHSDKITEVYFTPDHLSLISAGEALYFWDFLATARCTQQTEGRGHATEEHTTKHTEIYKSANVTPTKKKHQISFGDSPRKQVPKPTSYEPGGIVSDLSSIGVPSNSETIDSEKDLSEKEEILIGPDFKETIAENSEDSQDDMVVKIELNSKEQLGSGSNTQQHRRHQTPTKKQVTIFGSPSKKNGESETSKPAVFKHFTTKEKLHALAQRRYTAPPNQAGIKLKSVIGYNGNGRGNMVWQPDTGIFAFTSGCIVVLEDLNTGKQNHLLGHAEEVSCLSLTHDCQILASASGAGTAPGSFTPSQICLWDMQQLTCKRVLSHHEHCVQTMDFSRDDRFLISVGDYRESSIVVWSTHTWNVVAVTHTEQPIHDVFWDPYTVNEFASVGQNGSLLFWLLDETGHEVTLNVHEAEVPEDFLQTHHLGSGQVDFTCLHYAGDSTLYVGTNNGQVSAWDTRHNSCFMHWGADTQEIDVIVGHAGRLITGSTGRNLKLWSVVGISEMRLPGENNAMRQGGLTMEDELNLDGSITCGAFDESLDLGIVGTNAGTLWYINWTERASIRLVSGHTNKVNSVELVTNELLASCSDDGSVRVWSVNEREQTIQFQVVDQSCNCISVCPIQSNISSGVTVSNSEEAAVLSSPKKKTVVLPNIAAGYSNGTVRMFDLNRVEMTLKMHPHAVAVTAIKFSADGRMILSGGSDGLIAVSSPTTGMTVRVINDHQGAPITCLDVTFMKEMDYGVSAPLLWLATSADRRVSVWSSDWSKDLCELVDWLTFPAPAFTPDGSIIKKGDHTYFTRVPKSLARFSLEEQDIIVYCGYGMQKQLQFYSISARQVVRTMNLTHWATSLDLSPASAIVAIGADERLLKLMDYYEGSFQDFVGHNDGLQLVKFSSDGKLLFSAAGNEILLWDVCL